MPKKRKRGRLWSSAAGGRGHTVTVFERERDGTVSAATAGSRWVTATVNAQRHMP